MPVVTASPLLPDTVVRHSLYAMSPFVVMHVTSMIVRDRPLLPVFRWPSARVAASRLSNCSSSW